VKIEESEKADSRCTPWALSGCHCSVTEYWQFKPEVSWV